MRGSTADPLALEDLPEEIICGIMEFMVHGVKDIHTLAQVSKLFKACVAAPAVIVKVHLCGLDKFQFVFDLEQDPVIMFGHPSHSHFSLHFFTPLFVSLIRRKRGWKGRVSIFARCCKPPSRNWQHSAQSTRSANTRWILCQLGTLGCTCFFHLPREALSQKLQRVEPASSVPPDNSQRTRPI